jgi:gliding motility-associated-like protein
MKHIYRTIRKALVGCAVLTGLLIPTKTFASHLVGGDLYYVYVGPNQYNVYLKWYRDCVGCSFTACVPTPLCVSSASCGWNQLFPWTTLSGPIVVPTPPCVPNAGPTTCAGGTAYGIEEYILQATVTLPSACNDWIFSYSDCCRNGQITTLQPNGYYIAAHLDNLNFPVNSSPVFGNLPVTQFCVGNQFFYNQQAFDPDNDSLVYSLVNAEDDFGACPASPQSVIYNAPYSGTYPVSSANNAVTINPQTGIIYFIPNLIQVGVFSILVEEYRNGVKIGQTKRDIQINVVATCAVQTPGFESSMTQNGITANCGDSCVVIAFDVPIQCGSVDVLGGDIRALTPQGTPNPVVSLAALNCNNGLTDSVQVCFYLPLTHGTSVLWDKIGNDGNTFLSECGTPMPEFDSIFIYVVDPSIFTPVTLNVPCAFNSFTVVFPQLMTCSTFTATASDWILTDATGATIPISSVSGLGCSFLNPFSTTYTFTLPQMSTGQSPFYLIAQTGSDNNTVSNECQKFVTAGDTLAILNSGTTLNVNLGPDISLCPNDPAPTFDAGNAGSTYLWSTGATTQTITTGTQGTYIVTVSFGPNCIGWDTVVVNQLTAPTVSLGNDINLCTGDPFPTLDAGNPGAISYSWILVGTGVVANTQTYTPTAGGVYIAIVNTGGTCEGSDTVNVNVVTAPAPVIPDFTICSSDPFPVLDAGAFPGASYLWSTGATTQTITPTAGGTFSVTVSIGNCLGSDNSIVTVVQTPAVTLNDQSICAGDPFPTLDAGNPGASYLWSTGATSQTITTTAPGNYSVVVTNSSGSVICTASDNMTLTENPVPAVTLTNDSLICELPGVTASFDAGNSGANYQWSTGATTQTISPTAGGFYTVTVTDGNGCKGSATGFLYVEICDITIPNIFTPDGNNFNDLFVIKGLELYPNSELLIYNRWGNLIYDDGNYDNKWNGDGAPDGTYYYILHLADGRNFSGTVTITRK